MRTLEGGNVHKQMMILAKDYLEKLGYTVLLRAQIGYNTGIIDVLGIKNNEKVAIECQILPSQAIMEQKLNKYKPFITKLILAIPKDVIPHNIPSEIEVLKLDVEKPVSQLGRVTLSLKPEIVEILHNHNKYEGDMRRYVEEAIVAKDALEKASPKPAQLTEQTPSTN